MYIIFAWNVWICKKKWISRAPKVQREIVYIIYIRNVRICRKIESPKLQKFNGKLFTLYMYEIFGFAEILNIQNWENSTRNCVRYMHVMSRFAKKLNVLNCINSKENCVHYLFTECLYLRKNWMSKTTEIQREIMYSIRTECLDLQKNWISKQRKFNGKLCTIYVQNVWICRKI